MFKCCVRISLIKIKKDIGMQYASKKRLYDKIIKLLVTEVIQFPFQFRVTDKVIQKL